MSKLDKMIKELCPEGVEMAKLGDILDYKQPGPYIVKSTSYDDSYSTPVLTAGQSFILGFTNEDSGIYSASKDNPCIIFDDFTTSFHWVDFDFKIKSSAMKMLFLKSNKALLRYAYYAMTCIGYIPVEHSRHWISIYSQFEIPLPPLSIQQKIVSVLDSFTTLIDKMKQEVEKRKKQMEYYREKLLTFKDDECEWKTLGEVAEIGTGSGNTNEGLEEGLYPFYTRGQEVLRKNTFEYDEEAIITAGDGVGVGKVMHYVKGKYALHQRAYRFKPNEGLSTKYLYYYMQVTFYKYVCGNAVASSVSSLRKPKLQVYPIPVPSLDKQAEIVSTLDKFESYITKLEKMIVLRQKQYEYYREQLLTFE